MEKVKAYISKAFVIIGIIMIITHLIFQIDYFFANEFNKIKSKSPDVSQNQDSIIRHDVWKNTEFMEQQIR